MLAFNAPIETLLSEQWETLRSATNCQMFEKPFNDDNRRIHSLDYKRDRVTISKQYLEMFQRNPDEFLRRFITMDETWFHYFTPETKEQSKQWTLPEEPISKKAKTIKSAGKQMINGNY
ncbi:PREDICTED: uncharacterized protein LOC108685848 [Atta colombica]|uniref:uncharacterized protein LOC108685848 n=1 Tax=Atta colombica TaxID=520822 RepID=UPI00084BEB1E|nr:PREDICTED: uncharacterized protein LOC108685848 [Atta colombica]